jgi:hypothetical protein
MSTQPGGRPSRGSIADAVVPRDGCERSTVDIPSRAADQLLNNWPVVRGQK